MILQVRVFLTVLFRAPCYFRTNVPKKVCVLGVQEGSKPKQASHNCKCCLLELGGALKAFEKIVVNKILLSPMRANIKCPKALPRKAN